MSLNYFVMIVLAVLLVLSCKNSKDSTGLNKNAMEVIADDTNTEPIELATVSPEKEKYRLIVSFYSIGQGIDSEHHEMFQKHLENHRPELFYEEISWGREGEKDYCLKLTELSSKKQEEFIKNVRILLEKSDLVHIKENEECVHKR